ncbi:MAG: phenylacetate--CoA ligase family protein [Thermoguttaceae bacterium]|jgi:phenylacetate-CoA ligase
MLSQLYRRAILPGFETIVKGRKKFSYWRELERSQWLSRKAIEELQFERLRNLISYAFENCPYYAETWRALGLRPNDLIAPDSFARWPLVDREVIRTHRLNMRSTEPDMHLIAKTTGGSSGEPLHFDLNEDSNDRRAAASFRGYAWADAAPGTKQWYLWGAPPAGAQTRLQRLKEHLYHQWLYRHHIANSFSFSEQAVPVFLRHLDRCRPHVIVAYTTPLYEFARSLKERGDIPFSPRSIVVGAEKIHDFQRALIEEVFHAPVFETYGSREFMLMGAECDRHEGLHLAAENLLLEIVDDDGLPTPAGEEGNVVITDLFNYGMPFIRYVNGDRAVAGFTDCACGRGLPVLRRVVGRQLDVVTTPDGRRIPGEFFVYVLKDFASVRRFQVLQDRPGRIEIKLAVNDRWSAKDQSLLERQVRPQVGSAVELLLSEVDEIALTGVGKLQVVRNTCPQNGRMETTASLPTRA